MPDDHAELLAQIAIALERRQHDHKTAQDRKPDHARYGRAHDRGGHDGMLGIGTGQGGDGGRASGAHSSEPGK